MNDLEELKRICPPPTNRPVHASPDWDLIEQRLGTRLPNDYKELFEAYGPGGFFDFVALFEPQSDLVAIDIGAQTPKVIASLEKRRDWSGYRIPYATSSLQPAAVTDNGEYVFWVTEPKNSPDLWKIAVNEASGDRWFTFAGTMTAFLKAFCEHSISVPMFPDSLLEKTPYFCPASYVNEDRRRPDATSPVTSTAPVQSADIREWANRHGYDVPPRGRIPGAIIDAYKQAHNTE
ncbi:Lsr2 family DNA-binding protein [Streptomyces nigrescens]|nr:MULTISPECIES: histone-like nucleoid-structuring protein Lsr2 [Streptomyces]